MANFSNIKMNTNLSLLGLAGYREIHAEEEVGVLLLPKPFWFPALVEGKLLITLRVRRGDVSLNMASSDAELFTFVIPKVTTAIDKINVEMNR